MSRRPTTSFFDVIVEDVGAVRWESYLAASQAGEEGCQRYRASCPVPAEDIVNMAALKLWQMLAKKISFRLDHE